MSTPIVPTRMRRAAHPARGARRSRGPRIASALVLAVAVAGCGSSLPVTPAASADPPPSVIGTLLPSEPAPSRATDLAFLLDRLIATHPDPFPGEDRAAFEARLTDLVARADGLSDDEFLVEVMRLLGGRDRDGHTGLLPFAQGTAGITAWPLALYWFEEGLHVAEAQPPVEDAIGARVVEIGGRPIDEVITAVTPLVARDNEWTVRARLPGYLVVPQVLGGLGLLPDDVPALTLERADGTRFDLSPEAIPMNDWVTWRNLFDPLVPPALPADPDGGEQFRNRGEHFWSTSLGDALYVGYNQVQARSPSGATIGDLARAIDDALESGTASRVVVDIRANPGGENGTYGPLLSVLEGHAERDPGSVVVLLGRSTFSAAGNFATELRATPGVRFIGEPTGAAPNMFGDADTITLPASGLVVHLATRTWEFAPGDDSLAVEPDERVTVRWADYAANRDTALEAALAD